MAQPQFPSLLQHYLRFSEKKNECLESGTLDLGYWSWVYPTTLLPLGIFLKGIRDRIEYIEPYDANVANYLSIVIGELGAGPCGGPTYVPIVSLPRDRGDSVTLLNRIFELNRDGKYYGGEDAFKYLVSELVGNIYEHSEFKNARVMAQRYPKKGFVDISFFDDGISIPGRFEKKALKFEDQIAIAKAMNGLSTKRDDRGFGLRTNLRLFTKGLGGQMLVVSRSGAVYVDKEERGLYILPNKHKLQGTLVSIRAPIQTKKVDIYDYIE